MITIETIAEKEFLIYLNCDNLMGQFSPAFEKAGSYGNGPAWLGIIEFLAAVNPKIEGLDYDDESGAVVVRSTQKEPLEELCHRLEQSTSSEGRLIETIREAKDLGYGHGDL